MKNLDGEAFMHFVSFRINVQILWIRLSKNIKTGNGPYLRFNLREEIGQLTMIPLFRLLFIPILL